MPKIPLMYSKRQVDLAADVWRSYMGGNREVDDGLLDAMQVVDHYRACHQYLQKATVGLRSTARFSAKVAQPAKGSGGSHPHHEVSASGVVEPADRTRSFS